MIALWAYQLRTEDAGIADVGWAYAITGGILYFAIVGHGNGERRILAAFLGIGWGIRLGTHLLVDRIIKAKEEDGRYQNFRCAAGESVGEYFFFLAIFLHSLNCIKVIYL